VAAIAVNFLSQYLYEYETFIAMRLISGIGAGAVYAVAVAVIAGSTDTVRNFTYLMFLLVLTNAIVLYSFPYISASFGANGIFRSFCVLFALGLLLLYWLPGGSGGNTVSSAPSGASANGHSRQVPGKLIFICLGGIFSYYFMIGVFWAYVERIGIELGYTSEWMGSVLSTGTALSLIACVMAYKVSRWFGLSKPLIGALLLLSLVNFCFALNFSSTFFLISIFAVMGFWNFVDIYQMGTVADMDHSGRFAALVPGAQALPLAIAPAVAGFLLDSNWQYSEIVWLWGIAAALACGSYSLVYWRLRRDGVHVVD
jgi:MFS family permease